MANPNIAQCVVNYVGPDNISDGMLPAIAWPGGYPFYYVTETYTILCPEHANIEHEYDNERIIAGEVNWEDPELYCGHGERIPSAYAD